MFRKLGMIIIITSLLSCYSRHPRSFYTADHTSKETAGYQIQSGATTIGYAHKHQWEDNNGSLQYHYFIYDALGKIVGYVGEDGTTKKYLSNGKEKQLGSYTLEDAAGKIFSEYPDIRIFTARKTDVPVMHSLSITDRQAPSKHQAHHAVSLKKKIARSIHEGKVNHDKYGSASGNEKKGSSEGNATQNSSEKQATQNPETDDADDEWPE